MCERYKAFARNHKPVAVCIRKSIEVIQTEANVSIFYSTKVLELPTPSSLSVILTFCSILVGFMVLVCRFSLLVSRFLSVSGIEVFVSRGVMGQYFLVEIY